MLLILHSVVCLLIVLILSIGWQCASPGMHEHPACSILLSIMTVFCILLLIACFFVLWNCSKRQAFFCDNKNCFLTDHCSDFKNTSKIVLIFFKLHLCIVTTCSLCLISPNTTYKKTFNLFTALFFSLSEIHQAIFTCAGSTSLWCHR